MEVSPSPPAGSECFRRKTAVHEIEYKDEEHCTHMMEETCMDTWVTYMKMTTVRSWQLFLILLVLIISKTVIY